MIFSRLGNNIYMINIAYYIILNSINHGLEHIIGFKFIFHQGVLLTICTQAHALTQHIHSIQMLHPVVVHNLEHNQILQLAHQLGANSILALLIPVSCYLVQVFIQLLTAQGLQKVHSQETTGCIEFFCILNQSLQIPILGVNLGRRIHGHSAVHNLLHHFLNVAAQILLAQNLLALCINNLALLVHNIVIFQNVLTNAKVTCFHLLLGVFNGLGYQAVLDGLIILHAQLIHNACDIITAKETHQIILQAQEEFGGAGVALTSATATQLVIDTAAFMALGANDMQATQLGDALTQHDIGTTTSHIGSDGYSAVLTSQSNDFCFFFVVFSI